MRFVFVIALTLLAWPSIADAKMLDVQVVQSKSGIKAWLVEDHTVPVISLRFLFKGAGAVNDPDDKQGLSQILSNTLDEGAGPYDSPQFQAALNDHSISLGFNSSRDDFSGSLKTLSKYKDKAYELLALALTQPHFDKAPVGRMIESNLVRIRSNLTDPEWMSARLSNDIIFGSHPYARNSGGTQSSLPRIKPEDLRQKLKTQMAKDNLIVSIAGDMTAAEAAQVIDTLFADLPATSKVRDVSPAVWLEGKEKNLYKQDIPQTVINMVMPGISHTDPDYPAAEVMNFVLGGAGFGSRLTEEVREKKGLVYGIDSQLDELEYSQTLSIGTATRNESVNDVLAITNAVMAGMTTAPISDKELKDAKSYLIGSVPLQLTSTDRISGALLGLLRDNLPADYLEKRAERIQSLTVDDVLKVSRRLLDAKKMKIILVGQPKIDDNLNPITTLPNVE